MLAFNPPGSQQEGYLFWLSWLNHDFNSIFLTQDAEGPLRRGLLVITCNTATPAERDCPRRAAEDQLRRPPSSRPAPRSAHRDLMQKQAPSITQLVIIAGFALSCFGLLLFLWVSFGGPTPLKAKGYTLKVPLKEAGQLAEQSDVRISGVSVGKVTGIDLGSGRDAGSAVATVELNNTYAPIPENTRATLRQKTLLGETYVELTPGDRNDRNLPDGGELARAQVSPSVELDEIFRTFNARDPGRVPELDGGCRGRLRGRGARA